MVPLQVMWDVQGDLGHPIGIPSICLLPTGRSWFADPIDPNKMAFSHIHLNLVDAKALPL